MHSYDFLSSLNTDGAYHLFLCTCGYPDCGNWSEKIEVSTSDNILKWIDPNNDVVWHFDKNHVLEQADSIKEEVLRFKSFFKKKGIHYVGVGFTW